MRHLPSNLTLAEWVKAMNGMRPRCACCGKRIRVLPHHRHTSIPKYLRAHHPMAMTTETRRLRSEGLLTTTVTAKMLGIGASTLRRLEGTLFPKAPRRGTRRMRVFTPGEVTKIRTALRATTQLGKKVALVSLHDVARRAGCARETIRRRMGKELPVGRWITQPRGTWAFTRAEVRRILVWVKRHVKKPRRRRRTR